MGMLGLYHDVQSVVARLVAEFDDVPFGPDYRETDPLYGELVRAMRKELEAALKCLASVEARRAAVIAERTKK